MVDTSQFGKKKGTAVVTKRDGTKVFIQDSKVVKEISPEGKQRVRIEVAPLGTGARKRGVPAAQPVIGLASIALQEKKRKEQKKAREIALQQEIKKKQQAEAMKRAETARKIRQTQSLRQRLLTGEAPRIGEQPTTILKAFIPARQKELKETITRLDKSPYKPTIKNELRALARSYDPKVQRKD